MEDALSLEEGGVSRQQPSSSNRLLSLDKSDVLINNTSLGMSGGGVISSRPGQGLSLGSDVDDPLGEGRDVVSGDCCTNVDSMVYVPHPGNCSESGVIGLGEPQALFELPDCIYNEENYGGAEMSVYSVGYGRVDPAGVTAPVTLSPPENTHCKLCSRNFKSKASLESHTSAFHKNVSDWSDTGREERVVCGICRKEFHSRETFSRHSRVHEKTPEQIGFATKSVKVEPRPSRSAGERKRPPVQPTPERKPTPDELVFDGPPFVCNVCRGKFETVSEFRRHMISKHKKGRPFTCKFCPMRFKSQELLLNHTATHQLGVSKKRVFGHVCGTCQKPFASKYHLDNHLLNHSHTYKYKCGYCAKCFKWKSSFRYHIMYMHTDDRPHSCDVCEKKFVSGYHLNRHYRRLHSQERPYQCDQCLKCYKLPEDLSRHRSQVHTDNRRHECDECLAKFKTHGVLKKHKVLHEIRRQMSVRGRAQSFCCDVCTKVFPKLSSLQCHKLVHDREAEHGCSHCDKVFRFVSELKCHLLEAHHMKMHVKRSRQRKHQCEVCGATFISDRALMSHTEKHDPDGRYRCDLCGAGYHSRGDLSNHLLVDHGCRKEEKSKVIPCELCEASYVTKAGWRKHMDQVHSDSPRPVFECPICQNSFKCEDTVKSHIRFVHNPDSVQRLHCEECQKEFKRPSDLRAHRRRHLPTPKFECAYCKRSYRDRSSLNYHVRQKHTSAVDELVEMCKLCRTVYSSREELRKHAVIHYDPVNMVCRICNKRFSAQKTLWRHVRYHIMDQVLVNDQPTPSSVAPPQSGDTPLSPGTPGVTIISQHEDAARFLADNHDDDDDDVTDLELLTV